MFRRIAVSLMALMMMFHATYSPAAKKVFSISFEKTVIAVGDLCYNSQSLLWCELDEGEIVAIDYSGSELTSVSFHEDIKQIESIDDDSIMVLFNSNRIECFRLEDCSFIKTHEVTIDEEIKDIFFVDAYRNEDNTYYVLMESGDLYAFGVNQNGIIDDTQSDDAVITEPQLISQNIQNKYQTIYNRPIAFYDFDTISNEDSSTKYVFGTYSYLTIKNGDMYYTGNVDAQARCKCIPHVNEKEITGLPTKANYYPMNKYIASWQNNELSLYVINDATPQTGTIIAIVFMVVFFISLTVVLYKLLHRHQSSSKAE